MNNLLCGCRLLFGDQKQVLIISFHPVFFARKFLQGGRIVFKGVQLFSLVGNLLLIILLGFFQVAQFVGPVELREQVVAVQEKQDEGEGHPGEQIFILEPVLNLVFLIAF